jgi:hypothetical protein
VSPTGGAGVGVVVTGGTTGSGGADASPRGFFFSFFSDFSDRSRFGFSSLGDFGFFDFGFDVCVVVAATVTTSGVADIAGCGIVVTGVVCVSGWGCGWGWGWGWGWGCGSTAGGASGAASSSVGRFRLETGTDGSGVAVVAVAAGRDARGAAAGAATTTDLETTGRPVRDRAAGFGLPLVTTAATTADDGLNGEATTGSVTCWVGAEGSCTATPTATTPAAVEASGSKVAARCRRSIALDC